MFLGWWRSRRREITRSAPFPSEWEEILASNVWIDAELSAEERERLRDDVKILVAEKNWEGCGGLAMSDEIKVTVSAQVAIMMLGFTDNRYFDHVLSILVYPDAYVAPDQHANEAGVVIQRDSPREGEAWYRGPVILSWPDVLEGSRRRETGDNLVFHEFAHQLDMLNGREADGIPPIDSPELYRRWTRLIPEGYRRLVHDCRRGNPTLLDCYGATDISEYFAVATETFFQRPHAMLRQHPDLYAVFREFYCQDPTTRTDC